MPLGISLDPSPTLAQIQEACEAAIAAASISDAEMDTKLAEAFEAHSMSPEDAKGVVVEAIEETDAKLPEDPPDAYGGTGLDATATQAAVAAALTAYDPTTPADLAGLATSSGVTSAVAPLAKTSELAPLATTAGVTSALAAANVGLKDGAIKDASFESGTTVPLPEDPPPAYGGSGGGGGLTPTQDDNLTLAATAASLQLEMQKPGVVTTGSNTTKVRANLDGAPVPSGTYNPAPDGRYVLLIRKSSVSGSQVNEGQMRKIASHTIVSGVHELTFSGADAWTAVPSAGDTMVIFGKVR